MYLEEKKKKPPSQESMEPRVLFCKSKNKIRQTSLGQSKESGSGFQNYKRIIPTI